MKKYYLIAKKLSHSFSKQVHNALGTYSYEYMEQTEKELDRFFEKRDFDGLNVTIPYKATVIKYLDAISTEAEKIGAVNTIIKKDGKLYGYNTDYYGFMYLVLNADIGIKGKKVVILGNGGAAKTVNAVCSDMGALSVRSMTRENLNAADQSEFYDAQVIVNATPVGMYPDTGVSPVNMENFKECDAVIDLIYNPANTKLLMDASRLGIKNVGGLGMLVAQAKKASEIFTDTDISEEKIEQIRKSIENETKNIVLIGMPGAGKTSVGKELAKRLGREFFDCDEYIKEAGESAEELIEKYGEQHFRDVETEALRELCKKSGAVIATGGGAVTKERNEDIIRQNAIVVFIERPTQELSTKGRPLSQGGQDKLSKMYNERLPLYKKFCDMSVSSQTSWQKTAQLVIEELDKR